jgi:Pyruvate/2-oxoacid:ferredoxin oxidoreductase gamma subunit
MKFNQPWVWVSGGVTTAIFAILALVPLLAVADEVVAEAGLTAGENAAFVGFLTAICGVVPGVIALLICARIASRRHRSR